MGKPEPIGAVLERILSGMPAIEAREMTPCISCDRALVSTELPLFGRFAIKRAGIDSRAILERVGLCNIWGNSPGAAVMAEAFAVRPPARVLDVLPEVNVCHECMGKLTVMDLMLITMAKHPEREGDS